MLLLIWWSWSAPASFHEATTNWAPLLAQAPSPVNPNWFEQYGPLAIPMSVMTGFTWVLFRRFEKTIDLEREEKLAAQAELRELNKTARELMMPALTQANAAITEAMRVLRKDAPPS